MADWNVAFHDDFRTEMGRWPEEAQDELLAHAKLLERFGPQLRRPYADALKGSRHANMKELRFAAANSAWRVAFAFDPERRAILLTGGSKSGVSSRRFYKALIELADRRYDAHLIEMQGRSSRR